MKMIKKIQTLLLLIVFSSGLYAQNPTAHIQTTKGKLLGKTAPLKELIAEATPKVDDPRGQDMKKKMKEMPNFVGKKPFPRDFGAHILPKGGDPLAKLNSSSKMNGPEVQEIFNLEGISFNEANIWPPDVNGDIGKNYYVQGVNATPSAMVRVWDKVTGDVVETFETSTIWSEVGASPLGDILIVYDRLAERWLIVEISFSSITFAASQTDDPLGSYNIYEFSTTGLPDYPKLAVWEDAYYITTNEFDGFNPVYAFDRNDLLDGEASVDLVKYNTIPKFDDAGFSFEVSSAVDFAGTNSAGDTPIMVVRISDDEFPNADTDGIEYYTFKTDFDDPDASEIEGPFFIELAPFESNLCAFGIFDCLEQKEDFVVNGNDTTFFESSLLSALQNTIMHRPQYRRFADYESIVLNFSVDVTGDDVAGIRWVELRKTETTEWELHQEGTHTLNDGQNRWMGTIAQDAAGNTLLVYTLGGSAHFNSIAYAARRNDDPVGMLTTGELVMTEGEGVTPNQRWGDYFSIKTDAYNEDHFWFTAEYVPDSMDWATKVAMFTLRQDTVDVAMSNLVSPVDANNLSTTEAVEVRISNPGIEDASNIAWTVIFEGTEIESGVYTETLASGEAVNIPLTATVDMSSIGTYDFVAFVELEGDQYLLNDTLEASVKHIASYDLAVSNGVNNDSGCEAMSNFQGLYKNEGIEDITSFTATISVDGTQAQTVEVNEVLEFGESIYVDFSNVALTQGVNIIEFGFENLNNGVADEIPTNDKADAPYEVLELSVELTLNFLTDGFPDDNTWELVDDSGSTIYSDGPFPSGGPWEESFEMCVPEGCYTFTMFDSFGDGWGSANSYLEIVQSDGVKVALMEDTQFGDFWTAEFCVPKDCENLDVEVEYEDATGPTNKDAAIYINFVGAGSNAMYSIDGGNEFQSSPLFTNLEPGTYEVVVDDGLGCTYEETINVIVNVELYKDVEFTVSPNPTSGMFEVSLTGYDGPQEIQCHMINSEGKLVGNYLINKFSDGYRRTLLTPDLPAGVYYLSIQNEDFNQMKSIIKQ